MNLENKISIILPTLNEEDNVIKIIDRIEKDFNYQNYEFIFVDDGSTDNTQKQIKELCFNNKNIKYLFRKNDKDISRSFMEGVKMSDATKVILMDADLQHETKDLNLFIPFTYNNKYPLVNGSRFLKDSNIYGSKIYILFRISLSKLFIFICKYIFQIKLTDPLSGFFMADRDTLLKYENNLYKNGWKIMLDFYIASKKDIIIKELPITINKRMHGQSKLNFKVVINFCKLLIYHSFVK